MATKKVKKQPKKPANKSTKDSAEKSAKQPLRYAQPFFTSTPPEERPISPHTKTTRMADWTAQNVGPIPPLKRDPPQFDLASVIGDEGVKEIQDAGAIRFHAVGDTGLATGAGGEESVAQAMTADYHPNAGATNPAFFLHLGDVIYGSHKDQMYRDEFYRPYKDYPGKIIAIAGNHDGEVLAETDPKPCGAFLDNFCAPSQVVPPVAKQVGIFRETMTEPGVYWMLDAPFVQIIGLYSNVVEGPGYLVGKGNDTSQVDWLKKTLTAVAAQRKQGKRKALIVAVHHPPYSSAGHAGSPAIVEALDDRCQAAGVFPDAVLSGHAHNYQRYTRKVTLTGSVVEVPYIVAGCGGHAAQPVKAVTKTGDPSYDGAREGYGYLMVTANESQLKIEMVPVQTPEAKDMKRDGVVVNLKTGTTTAL